MFVGRLLERVNTKHPKRRCLTEHKQKVKNNAMQTNVLSYTKITTITKPAQKLSF